MKRVERGPNHAEHDPGERHQHPPPHHDESDIDR